MPFLIAAGIILVLLKWIIKLCFAIWQVNPTLFSILFFIPIWFFNYAMKYTHTFTGMIYPHPERYEGLAISLTLLMAQLAIVIWLHVLAWRAIDRNRSKRARALWAAQVERQAAWNAWHQENNPGMYQSYPQSAPFYQYPPSEIRPIPYGPTPYQPRSQQVPPYPPPLPPGLPPNPNYPKSRKRREKNGQSGPPHKFDRLSDQQNSPEPGSTHGNPRFNDET